MGLKKFDKYLTFKEGIKDLKEEMENLEKALAVGKDNKGMDAGAIEDIQFLKDFINNFGTKEFGTYFSNPLVKIPKDVEEKAEIKNHSKDFQTLDNISLTKISKSMGDFVNSYSKKDSKAFDNAFYWWTMLSCTFISTLRRVLKNIRDKKIFSYKGSVEANEIIKGLDNAVKKAEKGKGYAMKNAAKKLYDAKSKSLKGDWAAEYINLQEVAGDSMPSYPSLAEIQEEMAKNKKTAEKGVGTDDLEGSKSIGRNENATVRKESSSIGSGVSASSSEPKQLEKEQMNEDKFSKVLQFGLDDDDVSIEDLQFEKGIDTSLMDIFAEKCIVHWAGQYSRAEAESMKDQEIGKAVRRFILEFREGTRQNLRNFISKTLKKEIGDNSDETINLYYSNIPNYLRQMTKSSIIRKGNEYFIDTLPKYDKVPHEQRIKLKKGVVENLIRQCFFSLSRSRYSAYTRVDSKDKASLEKANFDLDAFRNLSKKFVYTMGKRNLDTIMREGTTSEKVGIAYKEANESLKQRFLGTLKVCILNEIDEMDSERFRKLVIECGDTKNRKHYTNEKLGVANTDRPINNRKDGGFERLTPNNSQEFASSNTFDEKNESGFNSAFNSDKTTDTNENQRLKESDPTENRATTTESSEKQPKKTYNSVQKDLLSEIMKSFGKGTEMSKDDLIEKLQSMLKNEEDKQSKFEQHRAQARSIKEPPRPSAGRQES